MMKRVISLVLCVLLLFNLFCVSAGAQTDYKFTDEQLTLLTAVGMYNDNVQLSEKLTRAQFADMLVKSIFEEPQYLIEGTERFNDVDENHDYFESIMLLKNLKVTYGDGNGNFNPEEEILTNDAIIMVVRFLGYTKLAERTGYIPFAAQKGISKGMQYEYSESLSMYNALILVYNVLNVDVSDRYVDDTASFMQIYRKFHKVEGIVEDDGFINKFGLSEIGNDEIVINGAIYKNATGERNLFGCSITGFYKASEDDEATIVALIKTKNNNTLIIDAKNIEKYNPSTRIYEYKENEFDDNTEEIEIPTDITIVYNGVPLAIDDTTFTNSNFEPRTGSVTFFDSNGDNKYDYLYINSYDTYVVSATDKVKNVIYMKDFAKPLELKQEKFEIVDEDGEKVELSSIGEGSTLSVLKSLTGEILKIYVSKETITDIVIAKDQDGSITTQNNGVFDLSSHFIDREYEKSDKTNSKISEALESVDFSVLYKLHIDVFGDVAYICPEDTNVWTTAAIIRAANNSRSKLSDDYVVQLYGFDGQISEFNLAEKVNITDQSNITGRYEDKVAIEILNTFAGNEATANRILRYKVNLTGLITDVELPLSADFPTETVETDRLFIVADATENEITYSTSGGFIGKVIPANDCKVLLVNTNKRNDAESYAIVEPKDVFSHDLKYKVLAYGTDTKSMTATHMIYLVSDELYYPATSTRFFVVSNITQEYDREEMVTRYKIDGLLGTTQASIYAENEALVNSIPVFATGKTVKLSPGDVIVYSIDSTDQERTLVNGIAVLYDANGVLESTGKGFFGEMKGTIPGSKVDTILSTSVTEFGNPVAVARGTNSLTVGTSSHGNPQVSPYRVAIGFVYYEKDGNVVLTTQPLNTEKYTKAANMTGKYVTETYKNITNKIIKIKKLSNGEAKVSLGTTADLKPYTVYGHDCAQVVFLGYWGVNFIYVIE